MPEPTANELLELDLDVRLAELWREAQDVADWTLPKVAAFVRLAYGLGYVDALNEPERGALLREHGYAVPPSES